MTAQFTFGSVCSGIEAASVAWGELGWKAAWLSEIEPFPSAVLAHHYPTVPNLGDMTTIAKRVLTGDVPAPDLLCGGTPCQAFSVAGLRESLSDERGNLSLRFVELADAIDHVRVRTGLPPSVVFWENVPGVLSTKDNAFGCFLAGLAGEDEPLQPPGGRWSNAGAVYGPTRSVAWRTLDAQWFGVAQRRRRVFVVASAGDRIDPSRVLFEWQGLRRDSAPSRQAGEELTHPTAPCLTSSGRGVRCAGDTRGQDPVVATYDFQSSGEYGEAPVAATLSARDYKSAKDLVTQPIAFPANLSATQHASTEDLAPAMGAKNPTAVMHPFGGMSQVAGTLTANTGGLTRPAGNANELDFCIPTEVAFTTKLHNTKSNNAGKLFEERSPCLDANSPAPALLTSMAVRRLTPVECERLQGFPDNYTNIPWRTYQEAQRKGVSYESLLAELGMTLRGPSIETCPHGPRYKALGNSWAVPVARWIGQRLQNELCAAEGRSA